MKFSQVGLVDSFPSGASAIATATAGAVIGLLLWQTPLHAADKTGETEFKEHCTACLPAEALSSRLTGLFPVRTAKNTVSDKEAKAIAEYIIKTFK